MQLFVGNALVIEWADVTNVVTGELDTTGAYQATVSDLSGDLVPGEAWPVPLSHDANNPGTYRGTTEGLGDFRPGQYYILRVTGTAGGGQQVDLYREVPAVRRTG